MGAGHSKYAPSKASCWAYCTASISYIADNEHRLPPDESSEAADEGTRAHAVAESMLRFSLGSDRSVRLVKADNPEMARHVVDYTRWVIRDLLPTEQFLPERKVPLFYRPSDRGTVDATIFGGTRLVFRDLKYGVGISVDAEENDQLLIYGESTARDIEALLEEALPDDMPVIMEIFQPRDMHNSEATRSWTITRSELRQRAKLYQLRHDEIEAGKNLKFVPSDKACQFCRAKGLCKAYAAQGFSVLTDEDAPVDAAFEMVLEQPKFELADPHSLTRAQRQRIIAGRKVLEKWLESVEDQEVHELMAGAEPIDFKLVEGKSNRQWCDEGVVRAHIEEQAVFEEDEYVTPAALKSVAQIEELFAGDLPEELSLMVFKPDGKPTLVKISDRRPALSFNPTEGLVDLDDPADAV